ncbi:hypothetical protein ACMFMF_002198 [Clarireedia jacksonii]
MGYTLRPWWSIFVFSLAVHAIFQAPPLQGPYSLGTTVLELNDPSTSRTMMLSLHLNSPILTHSPNTHSPYPILLFSPGYGTSRLLYTCTAEELASLGYLVILIDHPHDITIIEYLNGTVIFTPAVEFENYTAPIPYVNARVKDLQFVLDSLSNRAFTSHIPGTFQSTYSPSPFRTHQVGTLGHSLGGAAAFSAMRADQRFAYGANLDGALIGDVVSAGLASPFLIIGSEFHNSSTDPTWSEFFSHSNKKWKKEIEVKGTTHDSFTDLLIWADILGLKQAFEAIVGTIEAGRLLDLEREFLGSFFGKWLKGERGRSLNGEGGRWPEVVFDN